MPAAKSVWVLLGLVAIWVQCLGAATFGQGAVAFTPNVAAAPSGQTMTVTPAVSADRRYVRLSVNPFFNTVNGFSSFTIPLGAVSGGGLGGAAGLAGGGLGAAGGNFNAGMNGLIGPAGLESAVGFGQMGSAGQVGGMAAGALPYEGGFGGGFYAGAGPGWIGWSDGDLLSAQAWPSALASPNPARRGSGATVATKTGSSPRHTARKSVARRPKARPSHTAKMKIPSDEEPVVKPKNPS